MNKIAIVGSGGFGREVKWLIDQINYKCNQWEFIGYYDDNFDNQSSVGREHYLGKIDEINQLNESMSIVIAIGNPQTKKMIYSRIENPLIKYPTLIHPSCLIGNNINIGIGNIICAGNILTTDIFLNDFVILNLFCTVGHDTSIGPFSSIMPGVNISGEVNLGEKVYIGTGAKIINQINIGDNSIIGAGAVVAKSIQSNCTAVGVPAKIIKKKG